MFAVRIEVRRKAVSYNNYLAESILESCQFNYVTPIDIDCTTELEPFALTMVPVVVLLDELQLTSILIVNVGKCSVSEQFKNDIDFWRQNSHVACCAIFVAALLSRGDIKATSLQSELENAAKYAFNVFR